MLELSFWLIFGLLSGWAVALFAEPDAAPRRIGRSGIYGAIGALVGGWVARYFARGQFMGGFDGESILVAAVAAIIAASVFNLVTSRRNL